MLDLYYWPTPNGKKVTIHLAECELPYNLIPVSIPTGDQFEPKFIQMNPNARMPMIVDHNPLGGGDPISIFESGAIMLYLAEKTGKFMPAAARDRYSVLQWIMWQMANQGPKSGERNHFNNYAQADQAGAYAKKRFDDEVHRLYGVLNNCLYRTKYVAGDTYTVADMICYPWSIGAKDKGINLSEFKFVSAWLDELSERPAVQEGMAVGEDLRVSISDFTLEQIEEIKAMLFNQRAIPVPD